MKQTAVVFDFGGVLFKTSAKDMYREIFQQSGKSEAELEHFLGHVFTKAARSAANTGNMADVTKALAKQHPEWAGYIHAFDADQKFVQQIRGTIAGMPETLNDIAAKGYKIYGLTNWAADTFESLREAYQPLTGLFTDIVVSGAVGIKKPNPEIFKLAHDRFELAGHDVFYFDDKSANAAMAHQAAGWQGITFENAQTVRQALKL